MLLQPRAISGNSTVVYLILCRLFWLQYRLSRMADVRDSKLWVPFHLQNMACIFTSSSKSKHGKKKMIFWFSYSLCSVWSVKQEFDREKWVTCRKWKRNLDWTNFHGIFILLTENIAISKQMWVMKAIRNRLGWWYLSFKISALISCWPWLLWAVYRVDTSSFRELCDSVGIGFTV